MPRLVERARRPLALTREPARESDGAEWLTGDLTAEGVAKRLPVISTVFSLSPIWLLPPALPALIGAGARRIIAFSSTSRFTKTQSPISAERDVAMRLAQAEDRTAALCAAAKVEWTILRPTLIYAEGLDGNVSRLAGVIRRFGVLPLAGRGAGLRQPVHADDLATAALAAETGSETNRAYDLPGGETLTYRLMAERIFEGLDRQPRIVCIPPPLWSAAFSIGRPFLPGATSAMGARMSENLTFNAEPARRDLGWAPRDFHPDFSRTYSS